MRLGQLLPALQASNFDMMASFVQYSAYFQNWG